LLFSVRSTWLQKNVCSSYTLHLQINTSKDQKDNILLWARIRFLTSDVGSKGSLISNSVNFNLWSHFLKRRKLLESNFLGKEIRLVIASINFLNWNSTTFSIICKHADFRLFQLKQLLFPHSISIFWYINVDLYISRVQLVAFIGQLIWPCTAAYHSNHL